MTQSKLLTTAHACLVALFVVLLFLVPNLYFSAVSDDIFDEPREMLVVLLGGMTVLMIEARRVWQGRALLSGGSGTLPRRLLLAFLGWAALSAAVAVNTAVAWAYFATVAAVAVVGLSLVGYMGGGRGPRTIVLGALAALVGCELVIALVQTLQVPLLEWSKTTPALMLGGRVLPGGFWPYDLLVGLGMSGANGKPVGTFGNVNYLGEFLGLSLPVIVGLAAATSRKFARWGLALLAVAALGGLVATGARGALLGLLLGAPIAAVTVWGLQAVNPMAHWRAPGRRVLLVVAAVMGLGLVAVAGERVIQKVQARGQGDAAVEARLVNWRSDIGHVATHPIAGVGVGNYKVVNQDKLRADHPNGVPNVVSEGRFLRAHNEPLQALIEFGVVGFGLLAALVVAWWRAVRRNGDLVPGLKFGLLWGVGALLIAGCFGFPLHVPGTALALAAVLAAGLARNEAGDAADRLPLPWRYAYAAAAIALLAGVAVLAMQKLYLPQYQAHEHLFAARALYVNGRQAESAVVYGLIDRNVRYRGVYRIEYVRSLVETRRYDEALGVLEASGREGLSFEAGYWKARALWGAGRTTEAREAYKQVTAYFATSHRLHEAALRDLEAIQRGERLAPQG